MVLNEDLQGLKHGPEHPSLATEISGQEMWSCQQGQHTWQGKVEGKGKAGVTSVASQSVYSATMERRTVMSSGFPPKTQMKLNSVFEGKVKDVAQDSTGDECSVCGFHLPLHQTGESQGCKLQFGEEQEFKVILSYRAQTQPLHDAGSQS